MKNCFTILAALFILSSIKSQNELSIETMSPMPAFGRDDGIAFSIGSKGFVGLGSTGPGGGYQILKDLWEYDRLTDEWSMLEPLPSTERQYAISFSLDSMGLVFGGQSSQEFFAELWAYKLEEGWSLLSEFPGEGRAACSGFILGDYLYIGLGRGNNAVFSDFWKYNLTTNEWTELADFPGGARFEAEGFILNGMAYVGLGRPNNTEFLNDFWVYNPDEDSWQESCVFTEPMGYTINALLNNAIYFYGGQFEDLSYSNTIYKLEGSCNEKDIESTLSKRRGCSSFTIEKEAFFFGGLLEDGTKSNALIKIREIPENDSPDIHAYYNMQSIFYESDTEIDQISLYNTSGQLILRSYPNNFEGTLPSIDIDSGIYLLEFSTKKHQKRLKLLINRQ